MDSFLAVMLLDGCIGWLGALLLVVVGGLIVRQADTASGLVVAGAGALKLALNCCLVAPSLATRFADLHLDESLYTFDLVLVQLQRLAFFGLLAFALTRLGNTKNASEDEVQP